MEQNNNQNQQGANQQQTYQQQSYQQQSYQQPQYQQQQQQQYYQQSQQNYYQTPQATPDAIENKGLAALCYVSLIFVVIALLANGKSPFVRHHANQAVGVNVLMLLCVLVMIIPFIGWIVGGIGYLVVFIFMIVGFANAMGYKTSTLPICGNWKFFS